MAHLLPQWWSNTVLFIALISYVSVVAIYLTRFLLHDIVITYDNVIIYGILIISFTLLATTAFLKLQRRQQDKDVIETTKYFFHPYARIGWALAALHFISFFVFGHHTAFYYPIAILAYVMLAFGMRAGAPILIIFYVFSTIFHFPRHFVEFIVFLTKVGITLYMGTYTYVFVMQHFKRDEKEIKQP